MDWSKGFSAAFYASQVDIRTWKDTDRFEITGGSVSINKDGLRTAADIECVDYDRGEVYLRIWLDARQGSDFEHVPLFTGLAAAPDKDVNGNYVTNNVQCYSVLQPCEDVLLPRGWYVPAGTSAKTALVDLLSVTPAPVEVDGETPNLLDHIVAEEGENHLTMVEKILTAIGWRMKIAGDGTIIICEMADKVSAIFDGIRNDVIQTEFTETYDWYSAPNVIRAITDVSTVTVRDESDGPLSVGSRGREIWLEETDCNLNDGESLQSYAERRLREEQQVLRQVDYTRRFIPDLYPSDHITICYPNNGLDADFEIISQTVTLGQGAPVEEEVNGI